MISIWVFLSQEIKKALQDYTPTTPFGKNSPAWGFSQLAFDLGGGGNP
jgi:hypothetical protein